MVSYLVQEDGTSRLTLEERSGSLLLEESVATPDTPSTGPKLLPLPPEGKPLFLRPRPARVFVRATTPKTRYGFAITSPQPPVRARSNAPTLDLRFTKLLSKASIRYRAERDPLSLDLDRDLAVLLEA